MVLCYSLIIIVRIETLSTEELSFLIHLLICLWVWTHVYLFYSMGYTLVLSLFCYSNCFLLGHWELLQAVFCSLLTCSWHFLSIYLPSVTGQPQLPMKEMQEMWVWSLDWEDPLEKEMTTHSSILAWKSHEQRSLGGYSMGRKRVGHNWVTEQERKML